MKLYENIKTKKEKSLKILGIPIYRETFNYMTSERYKKILGGLVTKHRINNFYTNQVEKSLNICGLCVRKIVENGVTRDYFRFGKCVKSVPLTEILRQKHPEFFDEKYDDIYIINAPSGETYLFLTYIMDVLFRKNQTKKPLLIATRKYHVQLFNMICPEIPYILSEGFCHNIKGDSFNIDKFRFFNIYPLNHFYNVEVGIKSDSEYHYFNSILKRFNISIDEVAMRKIQISSECEKSMIEKVNKTGLDIDNFVFIAPEACSCEPIDKTFWQELIKSYEGYDIFVNQVCDNKIEADFKTCDLSFSEAFALAKKAKKIVSLRSGLTEVLLQTNVPMEVLYTKFKDRPFFGEMDAEQVMSGFTLSKIPFIDMNNVEETKIK